MDEIFAVSRVAHVETMVITRDQVDMAVLERFHGALAGELG
jgi:hypothetical protein